MISPDSDSASEGHPLSPEALAAGQRTLAAIVFTDTVGFSGLMSRNEELTLRLIARDMAIMKATCKGFGGQVLKSTGDGLLMLFTSAVQAVSCALEIQRDLLRRNLELPRQERLQHRIGIHLGDVFQSGGDVMGEGVNIAARLQSEAVPGGICLSNTVYEVVHNRLQFYVNDLGARRLKNIGLVTAYQISPLEPGAAHRIGLAWYRWRPWVWTACILLLLLVAMGTIYKIGQFHQKQKIATRLKSKQDQSAAAVAVTGIVTPPPAVSPPETPPVMEVTEMEFDLARREYMDKYDFDGMQDWIEAHNWPGKGSEMLAEKCRGFEHMFNWCRGQLTPYTAHDPFSVKTGGSTFTVWPTAFGGLKMKSAAHVVTVNRADIPPRAVARIVEQLLENNRATDDPEVAQVREELPLFIEMYHVKGTTKSAPVDTVHPGTP